MFAVSVGPSVPPAPFDALLHSLFETAVNLQVNSMDILVTLYSSDTTDLPQGIRVQPVDFRTNTFAPGQKACAREGRLYLPGALVDLRRAVTGRHDLEGVQVDLSKATSRAAWGWVSDELARRQIAYNQSMGGLGERLSSTLARLEESTRHFDFTGAEEAASDLIGLGTGLTPSGDDILLGYYAGLCTAAGHDENRLAFLACFGKILELVSMYTNDISRTYLLLAAHGQFSSSLAGLARAVSRGDRGGALQRSAQVVFDTGHSSGCDTATGLLAGLAVWHEKRSFL